FSRPPDFCRLNKDAGPCLGMVTRHFYNSTSRACETFLYGGCLGNGNNFHSEKDCLQACRTEGKWSRCMIPRVSDMILCQREEGRIKFGCPDLCPLGLSPWASNLGSQGPMQRNKYRAL
uniref:BPTI/Kunitz inhibitor domain-containing protein n=1 Tax=Crocodylus porosus TaxID=8502 RepID=A0A7M4EYT7_CROPO